MTEWYLLYVITLCTPDCQSIQIIVPITDER